MTDITDIFGNAKIDNKSPFIVVTSLKNTATYANKIDTNVWRVNTLHLSKLLKENNIDISYFLPAGHFQHPSKLLLVNKIISHKPTNYVYVSEYNSGSLWAASDYKNALSLIYSPNKDKPTDYNIGIINPELLIQSKQSEYNLLTSNKIPIHNINKDKIREFHNNVKFKLMSNTGKFLTLSTLKTDEKQKLSAYGNKLRLKSKKTTDNMQTVNYTASGELKIDDKCVTLSDDEYSVVPDICATDIGKTNVKQKWFPFDGNYVSQYNSSCLSHNNKDDIVSDQCSNKDSQIWDTEFSDQTLETDQRWKTKKGKYVILVSSDNPWYINIDDKISLDKSNIDANMNTDAGTQTERKMKHGYFNSLPVKKQADFENTYSVANIKEDHGFGWSIKDKYDKMCQYIDCSVDKIGSTMEYFNVVQDDDIFSMPIFWLVLLIVVFMVWRKL